LITHVLQKQGIARALTGKREATCWGNEDEDLRRDKRNH
jgi:hypothetical protein